MRVEVRLSPRFLASVVLVSILLPLLFGFVSEAGFLTFYPVYVSVAYVRPPVVFDTVTGGFVSTSLGLNRTSANVTVEVNVSYVIALVHRSAVYWSNFTRDPFETGELIPLTGSWSWNGEEVVLTLSGWPSGYGGEAIALFNVTLPESYNTIYIEYDFRFGSTRGYGWADTIFMLSDRSSFYTVGVHWNGSTLFFSYYPIFYIEVYEYNGSWTLLNSTQAIGQGSVTSSYDMTSFFEPAVRRLGMASGTDVLLVAYGDRSDVAALGIGGYLDPDSPSTLTIYFDYVIVTVDVMPFTVNVTGLQPGWTVDILDENNNRVASGTADSTGTAVIDFWHVKFLPNATIVIYDSWGNPIASQRFDWVVGGDVYRLYNPLEEGFSSTVLEAANNSTQTFTAWLRLRGFSVEKGTVYTLNVTVEAPGSKPLLNITIVNGAVVSSIAGPVTLYPGYSSYVGIYVNASMNTSVVLYLDYVYGMDGVTVYYPVKLQVQVYDPPPKIIVSGVRVFNVYALVPLKVSPLSPPLKSVPSDRR